MDAQTARTVNIRLWVAEAGGPAAFAEKFGDGRWVAAQVSQWISESNPKGVGHKLARTIEERLQKPAGIMDREPAEGLARYVREGSDSSYHAVRFDPDKLAESIAALRQVAKNQGWDYDPETHPQETIYAYELRCAMPANPTTAQVIDFGAKVAQRLQQQQARGSDGPGDGKQVGQANRKRS